MNRGDCGDLSEGKENLSHKQCSVFYLRFWEMKEKSLQCLVGTNKRGSHMLPGHSGATCNSWPIELLGLVGGPERAAMLRSCGVGVGVGFRLPLTVLGSSAVD